MTNLTHKRAVTKPARKAVPALSAFQFATKLPGLILPLLLSLACAGRADDLSIKADSEWKDVAGNEILAQGGCILQAGSQFYWYGVEFSGETPRQVRCYSSKDLANWKFEGPVLDQNLGRRVKVIKDANQFVMFTRDGTKLRVAVSSNPAGRFAPKFASDLPQAVGNGDVSAFRDEDGKCYLVYNVGAGDREKEGILLTQLKPDRSGVEQNEEKILAGAYEAPSLWKHGSLYYLTASAANGWYSSPIFFATSKSLVGGPWSPARKISKSMVAPAMLVFNGFNTQHNGVFEIKGSQGSLFVYMGDRWSQFTHYGTGKQVWLPLEFDGDTPVLTWYRPWHPDVATGTFTHELRNFGLWRGEPAKKSP